MSKDQVASALVHAGLARTMQDAVAALDDYYTDDDYNGGYMHNDEYEGSWRV